MESIYFQSGEVSHGIKHYMVDTENDKLNLPRNGMLGNRCYVIATKKWYILDGSGEWVPFAAEGGSVDADAILSVIDGMSDSEKSQLRSELGVASVFTFKGVVEEESDLPSIGNNSGDVYLVNETSSEYVWITTSSAGGIDIGRWEELGSNVGGEPELYFVTFTYTNQLWNADKTIVEINTAYLAGKTIVFKFGDHLQLAGKGNDGRYNYFGADILAGSTVHSLKVMEAIGAVGSSYAVAPVDSAFSMSSENPVQNKLITAAMNNASQAIENKISKPTVVSSVTATVTIEPEDNTIYKCGELTSLTITNPPATGSYVIKFISGATPTTTTIPTSIVFPDAFSAEANTRYEINVEDGYAVAVGWPVS